MSIVKNLFNDSFDAVFILRSSLTTTPRETTTPMTVNLSLASVIRVAHIIPIMTTYYTPKLINAVNHWFKILFMVPIIT